MRISLLCSDVHHPVNKHLERWVAAQQGLHQVELVHSKRDLSGGDILFLISCAEIVDAAKRSEYSSTLVLHASDLPLGRGWSPHIWQLIEGSSEITLSLLEAEDKVDSGRIWKKIRFSVPKYALWNDINARLFDAEIKLIDYAVREFGNIQPIQQSPDITPTYYSKRSPKDSQIDPEQSIANQFDKIRVCDPIRFPAFFELHGQKFKIILEKFDE